MYSKHYPNIELLVYQTRLLLLKEDKDKYNNLNLNVDIFPQTWGSTALGFGGVGGQAITTAYTTVFHETYHDIHAVFFSNQLAYIVKKSNEAFNADLLTRNMADVRKAVAKYEIYSINC